MTDTRETDPAPRDPVAAPPPQRPERWSRTLSLGLGLVLLGIWLGGLGGYVYFAALLPLGVGLANAVQGIFGLARQLDGIERAVTQGDVVRPD